MIDRDAFYNAAHACYCDVEASLWDEVRCARSDECPFGAGDEITACIEPQPDYVLFGPMFDMLASVQRAWGCSIASVLQAGHVTEPEAQEDFLFLLVMGCFGHGIGLWDGRFDAEMQDARNALAKELDATPVYLESPMEWYDAAHERVLCGDVECPGDAA